SRTGYNVEHVGYRDGVLGARDRALGRLTAEAVAHEAHGVVGVRVFIRRTGDGGVLLEFSVVGTAIRRRGVEPLPRPFTSHLSGQEFVKLLGIGFVPMTMVFAIGVIECIPGCGTELAERAGWNVELTQVGEAASASRRLADEQMRYAARGADGVVGVEIRSTSRRRGPSHRRVYESIAIGTAARRFDPAAAGHVRPALTMVRLADRSTVDVGGAAAPRRS
ncbi:MAG TPA: heavy metal-binding domain-containing protein, partial [Candidatus Dormibacteraeota bacterium]|nr:heavy metal-binding domain-containing protein [Candidatus Dormibacteraeota bacterium]